MKKMFFLNPKKEVEERNETIKTNTQQSRRALEDGKVDFFRAPMKVLRFHKTFVISKRQTLPLHDDFQSLI